MGIGQEFGTQHAASDCSRNRPYGRDEEIPAMELAGKLTQKFLLVHAVFEGFTAVDEDHRDFVIELAAKFGVAVNVDFPPGETAPARKLGEAFFHDFAEMAPLAGIHYDAASLGHRWRF